MIEIEIDGKTVSAEEGQMVIDVADKNDIYIPRFCYHKKLSIAANCRMCLVEIEKSGKPLPACATPVTGGMKVFTKSKKAIDAQRIVMEFLLINHPLDCPICDQGGECELQDTAMGYGEDISRYTEGKRSVEDEDLGPLISTEMTRCIHCTRCVRFGTEVAGMRELGMTGRGEHARIGTYIKDAVKSEVSGNIIDLCPVGALTNKPFRFKGRSWEMTQHRAVAPHDCIGSNIYLHTRGFEYTDFREVLRVVPRDNESINEMWISDRDRYSYEAINSPDRVQRPLIRKDGEWVQVDWATALDFAVAGLQTTIDKFGADHIGAIASPNSTTEELYLLQKLCRGIGCSNIDHRLKQLDFRAQHQLASYPSLGISIEQLSGLQTVLLVGSDVRREQPIAGLKLREAFLNGATLMAINAVDYDFHFDINAGYKNIVPVEQILTSLAGVLVAVAEKTNTQLEANVANALANINPSDTEQQIAQQLIDGNKTAIFLGAIAEQHPKSHDILTLAEQIAKLTDATVGRFSEGANCAGAWLAGAVPHRKEAGNKSEKIGMNAFEMFHDPRSAYILLGAEPEIDSLWPEKAHAALKDAFVVTINPFNSDSINEYADVILPVATFAETAGTFVNASGDWQTFVAAGPPFAESRPAWKVLRVLGNLFDLHYFDYVSASDICDELKSHVDTMKYQANEIILGKLNAKSEALTAVLHWPMYCVDGLVRRAPALQATLTDADKNLSISPVTANGLGLTDGDLVIAKQGDIEIQLPVRVNERLADGLVLVPAGVPATRAFGHSFTAITLQRGN